MRIDTDLSADSAYLALTGGQIARTVQLSPRLLVDEDRAGAPVGVEVLGLDSLPVAELLDRYPLPQRQADQLRALAASWARPALEVA